MPVKPETKIVRKIEKYVAECKGLTVKLHGNAMQEAGHPDLFGYVPDENGKMIHFAIEVKLPGKEPRPLQVYRLRQWGQGGFVTGVATSVETFKDIINGRNR